MNVLSEEKKQQVIALGRLGWSLRRIQQAARIRRETAGAYLRAAGIPVRPPGGWGHGQAKPAIQVSTDSGAGKEPFKQAPPRDEGSPCASACEPHREFIEAALAKGRNAMAIWQDLVDGYGFGEKYASVKRFVRNRAASHALEASMPSLTKYAPIALRNTSVLRNECQRRRLHIDSSSRELSMTSGPPNTSLPQKLRCLESEAVCKLLKRWSGRWDSNPRRRTWEPTASNLGRVHGGLRHNEG